MNEKIVKDKWYYLKFPQ